jgi:folate-binding protein YgfZ
MEHHDLPGYDAAQAGSAYFPQTQAGFLLISGPDRSAYLQRQTTNDVRVLRPGQAVLTVLTTPSARILDIFYLFSSDEEEASASLSAISLPGRSAQTTRYLKSRIFFNDHVTVENASGQIDQYDLVGPQAESVLTRMGFARLPATNEIASGQLGDSNLHALHPEASFSLGYRLWVPADARGELEAALQASGAVRLSPDSYEILRIEKGLPGPVEELTERFTPLETGLEAAISQTKGCYTGQEVIARQITYDKITQQLTGLRLEAMAKAGQRVWVDGKSVGVVTSAVRSPRFGHLALAVIKRPYHAPGTAVLVGDESQEGIPAVTSPPPFHNP